MSSFQAIPNELIALILDELDVPSLLICMQVCKQLQSIIQQSSSLLYKICLFSGLMSDVKHCNWDLPSRLEAIRRYTDAWNNLHFPTHGQIPRKGGQAWDLVSGILAQSGPDGGISCVQMPCSVKGILERRWITRTDFRIRDFTIDMSQDLLVAIELGGDPVMHAMCHVHLRSCTTGLVHPKATCPRITPEFFSQQIRACFLIRVCGPYVGILFDDMVFRQTTAVLAIWNWRTGSQIMLIRCPEIHSFTFISDELLLVAFVDHGGQVSLRVLAVTPGNSMSSAEDVQYLCELRLPILRADVEGVLIISEPSPTSTSPNIPAAPFTASTDVLFTVTLSYSMDTDDDDVSAVVLLVPRSTILHQVSCVSSSPQKYVGWESWGETGSRMLDIKPSNVWVCHSYGMKFIHSPDHGETASVYDLNPHATRKDVNTANPHLRWKAMEGTKISGGRNPFRADVVTSLPGREASLNLIPNKHGWDATMITEDHIMMVQPPYGPGSTRTRKYAYMAM